MNEVSPKKLAAGYFLGFMFFVLAVLLWLRGMARFLLPALMLGLVAYGVHRFIRKIKEPVD